MKTNPSDFTNIPYSSACCKAEGEEVACKIMLILERTGNVFRELSWEEYKHERLKDKNSDHDSDIERREKSYFDEVIKYCKSAETAKLFSRSWEDKKSSIYIENPKTNGSGIVCCIPQTGACPVKCEDCFFQSGRSYLEPLSDNLPNMPNFDTDNVIVRVNDGNDSNNRVETVIDATKNFKNKFYNTSFPNIDSFDAPVVVTINPHKFTDNKIYLIDPIPNNLMFVRVRTNTWNLHLVDEAIEYYAKKDIAVILTFMAYYDEQSIPEEHRKNYMSRKRTLNSYHAITTEAWKNIMHKYEDELRVYSCGKIEGEIGKTSCKYCGNCLREYYLTINKKIK